MFRVVALLLGCLVVSCGDVSITPIDGPVRTPFVVFDNAIEPDPFVDGEFQARVSIVASSDENVCNNLRATGEALRAGDDGEFLAITAIEKNIDPFEFDFAPGVVLPVFAEFGRREDGEFTTEIFTEEANSILEIKEISDAELSARADLIFGEGFGGGIGNVKAVFRNAIRCPF